MNGTRLRLGQFGEVGLQIEHQPLSRPWKCTASDDHTCDDKIWEKCREVDNFPWQTDSSEDAEEAKSPDQEQTPC